MSFHDIAQPPVPLVTGGSWLNSTAPSRPCRRRLTFRKKCGRSFFLGAQRNIANAFRKLRPREAEPFFNDINSTLITECSDAKPKVKVGSKYSLKRYYSKSCDVVDCVRPTPLPESEVVDPFPTGDLAVYRWIMKSDFDGDELSDFTVDIGSSSGSSRIAHDETSSSVGSVYSPCWQYTHLKSVEYFSTTSIPSLQDMQDYVARRIAEASHC